MKKVKKVPKIFRKKYKEKAFNKKILKRIHIPKEREKVEALFEKNEKDRYVLKGDISQETIKKLKPLAKTIKKNKGLVTKWKAIIVLIIVGSVVFFNFIFKDKLIESFAESGLESLFEAEVEIEKLHLSLFKGILSYESLAIADADKPMFNLVETGRAVLKINMRELAFKRVHIEEIALSEVLWDTPRKSDGSLVEGENGGENTSEKEDSSLMDTLSLNSGDFDYQAIINSQKENLSSLKLLSESNQKIEEAQARWTGILYEKESEVKALSDKVDTVKSISLSSVQSVDEAASLIGEVQSYYPEVEAAKESVVQLNRDFKSEKETLFSMKDSLSYSIDTDMAYLVDTLDITTGDFSSIASDLAEDYVRARWNNYYEYGLKAWNIVQKLQSAENEDKAESRGLNRAAGRTILFPSPDKPSLFIGHAGLTGGDEKQGHLVMDIKSISSEPDKTKDPVSLNLILTKGEQIIVLKGVLDLKTDSPVLFFMTIDVPGNPVALEKGIPVLGINRLTSIADTSLNGTVLYDDDTLVTVLKTELTELDIIQSADDSVISTAVNILFDNTENIELIGEIAITKEGIDSIFFQSDFDTLLQDSLGSYLEDLKSTYTRELKDNLLQYLSPDLEKNEAYSSSLDALGVQSINQISSVNRVKDVLDDKVSELENRGDAIADELKSKAQSEAESLVDKAKDKIKLPGF